MKKQAFFKEEKNWKIYTETFLRPNDNCRQSRGEFAFFLSKQKSTFFIIQKKTNILINLLY